MKQTILFSIPGLGLGPPGPGNPFSLFEGETLPTLLDNNLVSKYIPFGSGIGVDSTLGFNEKNVYDSIFSGWYKNPSVEKISEDYKTNKKSLLKVLEEMVSSLSKHEPIHLFAVIGPKDANYDSEEVFYIIDLLKNLKFSRNDLILHIILDEEKSENKQRKTFLLEFLKRVEARKYGAVSTLVGSEWIRNANLKEIKNFYTNQSGIAYKSIDDFDKTTKEESTIKPSIFLNYDSPFDPPTIASKFTSTTDYSGLLSRISSIFSLVDLNSPDISDSKLDIFSQLSSHKLSQVLITLKSRVTLFSKFVDNLKPGQDLVVVDDKSENIENKMLNYFLDEVDKNEYNFIFLDYPFIKFAAKEGDIPLIKGELSVLDKVVKKIIKNDTNLIITSTHGQGERMFTEGKLDLGLTRNPVPVIYSGRLKKFEFSNKHNPVYTVLQRCLVG